MPNVNKLEQKKLEFLKDQNLIKINFNETTRGNILRKYDIDLKRLKLSNKKIKTKHIDPPPPIYDIQGN